MNKKYILNNFTPLDGDYLARTLEKQARKGWMLCKYGNMLLHFSEAEPQELHYAVTFFPEATEYDPHMSEDQETYIDLCAAQGWTLTATKGPMQIFQTDRTDPVPIETDEAYKLQAIHGAIKKSYLLGRVLLLLSMLLQLVTQWQNFQFNAFSMVSSNTSLTLITAVLLLTGYLLFETVGYFIWYYGSKQAVAEGKPCLPTLSRLRNLLLAVPSGAALLLVTVLLLDATSANARIYYLLILAATISIFVILSILLKWFKKLGWDGKKTRNATMAISVILSLTLCGGMVWYLTAFDLRSTMQEQMEEVTDFPDPLLTLYDLTGLIETAPSIRHDINTSVLATHTRYSEDGVEGSLEYHTLELGWNWLRELVFDTMAKRYHFTDRENLIRSLPYQAEKAYMYSTESGHYRLMILYDDSIFYIDTDIGIVGLQLTWLTMHIRK